MSDSKVTKAKTNNINIQISNAVDDYKFVPIFLFFKSQNIRLLSFDSINNWSTLNIFQTLQSLFSALYKNKLSV